MVEPVRWGILGAGRIAATVAADIAASDASTLAAVGARDGVRSAAFAQRHGVERSYGSYRELVADPQLDIIYVATTHAQHHAHALLALQAGKAVLVEKAFTLNARQAREVVSTARAQRLFCMEAMWMRFNPLIRDALRIARSGRIGDIVSVRADLSHRFAYAPEHRLFDLSAGGGALLDLGVYPATFAGLFLGPPATVQAAGDLSPTGSDVTALVQLGYRSGQVAQLHSSAACQGPYAGLVTGTEGWIRIDPPLQRPTAITVHTEHGEDLARDELRGNGYRLQVAEVERCLRAGELESPAAPLEDTVAILEILDEARRQIGVHYPGDNPTDGG
ncbi:MAG: oxidoreductase [Pseudonocardiales bacterium]|nr:MAG: oxidoreductase [Pseudonocardiales bacterium]